MIALYKIESIDNDKNIDLDKYLNLTEEKRKEYFEEILFRNVNEKFAYGKIEKAKKDETEDRKVDQYIFALKYLLLKSEGIAIDFTKNKLLNLSFSVIQIPLKKEMISRSGENVIVEIEQLERSYESKKKEDRRVFTCKRIIDYKLQDFVLLEYAKNGEINNRGTLILTNEENYLKIFESVKIVTEVFNNTNDLDLNLKELEKKSKNIDLKLEKAKNDKEIILKELNNIDDKITKTSNVIEQLSKKGNLLSEFIDKNTNFIDSCVFEYDNVEKLEINDLSEIIKYIKGYISYEYKLCFTDKLIENMLLAVYSNQLIILAGKPGSGKTTFAQKFAKATGECEIVSVQANWMDRSDLLGYYNPIDKSFQASIFLEKLVKLIDMAKLNKDVLYYIILDEMNLSTVEYYFADFLSAWNPKQDYMTITLYSYFHYKERLNKVLYELNSLGYYYVSYEKDLKNFLKEVLRSNNTGIKFNKLKDEVKNLIEYPYELKIPHNLKFIGTINIDATTKDLSPKVIDRSYFIRMEYNDDNMVHQNTTTNNNEMKRKYVKYVNGNQMNIELWKKYSAVVNDIREKLKNNLPVNNRFNVAAENILKFLCTIKINENVFTTNVVKDYLIAALILPKVSIERKKKKKVDDICDGEICGKIKEQMISGNDDIVCYWRALQ